jgi:SAM-dependent methyltransferase
MHDAALQWARQVWTAHPPPPRAYVLELGSYDVNGTARVLMADRPDITWWGVDLRRGPGVDEIGDARWWRSLRRYDYVICMEMLEHTPEPERVLETIYEQLAPGGRTIITCAGPHRAPHGCDGGPVQPGEHYGAIDPRALEQWLRPFRRVYVHYDAQLGDLYATAIREA